MGPGFESLKADHVYKRSSASYKHAGPLVKWLRQRPLTPLTSVRIRYGSPPFLKARHADSVVIDRKIVNIYIVGADWCEGPPVPIPNTEVKLTCAEDTCRVTGRENR